MIADQLSVADRVTGRIQSASDVTLAMIAGWSEGLRPEVQAVVDAELRQRHAASRQPAQNHGAVIVRPAPTGIDRLTAVTMAARLIREDTPGNVVPPQAAVRALLAAGVEWRCRLAPGRERSLKGHYQYRLPGDRAWRTLANTPQVTP